MTVAARRGDDRLAAPRGAREGRAAMRIGILSDTHDRVERTARAVRRLADLGAACLVHCGDFTRPDVLDACAVLPAYFVFGNNDFDQAGLRRAAGLSGATCLGASGVVDLAGKRVAVTHGDLTREVRRLAASAPDYLLYGHSHEPADARDGPTRWVNPGALHRAARWTVALLDLDTDALELLTVDDRR
jgi:putative phosphoesterase